MAYDVGEIIRKFESQQEAARLANERRYAQIMALSEQVVGQYEPGGAFGAGYAAQLERTKTRDVAAGGQALVGAGLFGTTVTAGLPKKWEEEVGQPARLRLEDVRMGRYAEALQTQAGAIERREDIGPDYATIAQLAMTAATAPQPQPQRRISYVAPQLQSTRPSPMPTGPVFGTPGGLAGAMRGYY